MRIAITTTKLIHIKNLKITSVQFIIREVRIALGDLDIFVAGKLLR